MYFFPDIIWKLLTYHTPSYPKVPNCCKIINSQKQSGFGPPCTCAAFNTYQVCDVFDSRCQVKTHDVIPCRQTAALPLRLVRLRPVRLDCLQYRNEQRTQNARQYLTTTRIMSNDINDQNLQLCIQEQRLTKRSAVTGKLFNAPLSVEGDLDYIEYLHVP